MLALILNLGMTGSSGGGAPGASGDQGSTAIGVGVGVCFVTCAALRWDESLPPRDPIFMTETDLEI